MCTLYSRHNLRHEDISINIGSYFQGTHTSNFYHLGFLKCSKTMWTFSIIHFISKKDHFTYISKVETNTYTFTISGNACGSLCRCVALPEMWRSSIVLRLLCDLESPRKFPAIGSRPPPQTVSSEWSGCQEYAFFSSITGDSVATDSMQGAGPGLSTGSDVEWKEGLPHHCL